MAKTIQDVLNTLTAHGWEVPTPPSPIPDGYTWRVKNKNSGQVITITGKPHETLSDTAVFNVYKQAGII